MAEHTLIIGGASGIGFAAARRLVAIGHRVTLAGRNQQSLAKAQDNLAAKTDGAVNTCPVDVADERSIEDLFDRIGKIDHLVVTAGSAAPGGPVADLDLDAAKAAFGVKFWGSISAARQAVRHMASDGSITLTSGLLARKTVPGTLVKSAINAALEAGAKVLARELAPVRVNVICPGLADTEAYAGMDDGDRAAMFENAAKQLPVGRVGQASDLADAYLLVIGNSFMTGAVIDVEGGGLIA